MYDFLLPYYGEYFDDAWTYAGDRASVTLPLLRRIVYAHLYDARRAASEYAISRQSVGKQLQLNEELGVRN